MPYSLNDIDPAFRRAYEDARSHGYNSSFEQWFVNHMHDTGAINSTSNPAEVGLYEQLTGINTGRLPLLEQSSQAAEQQQAMTEASFLNAPELAEWRNVWKSPESSGGRSFGQWLRDHISEQGDKRAAQVIANLIGDKELTATDMPWAALVAKTIPEEYQAIGGDGQAVPLEQGLMQTILPRLTADIERDDERTALANALAQQAINATAAANTQLQRSTGGGFDGRTYFAQNPDVAAAYERQGGRDGNGIAQTIDQFAEDHYLAAGQREGRRPFYTQSPQLAQDFENARQVTEAETAAARQAATAQLGALENSIASMQGNLQGELAAKAAALQQQIAALNQNLDTLDASQRQALAEMIASQQQNLEQSIAAQRQALSEQLAQLGNAADTQAQAQRAALQQEVAALTAAQEPLAQARLQAAEGLVTAVNLGLESTKDKLMAQDLMKGYVGGSTARDAAMVRATVGARQEGANAVGTARAQNAADTRDIGVRGATGERSISDALAAEKNRISQFGANTGAGLSTALAQGTQALGDTKASGLAGITANTALSRAAIGAQGANTTYADTVTSAADKRKLGDALATGTYGIKTNEATQVQDAQNKGTAAKATYYDADYGRKLGGALGQVDTLGNLARTLTGIEGYGSTGTDRALNTLNWWSTNTSAAPTPGAIAVQPNTTGNAISQLGGGLLNLAGNIGASQNWWAKPNTTTPKTPQLLF